MNLVLAIVLPLLWLAVGTGRKTLPVPAPDSQQPEEEPEAEDEGQDGGSRSENMEIVAAACERAGEFGLAEIAGATDLHYRAVTHWVEVMTRLGWIEKVSYGRYRWKGRGSNA